MNKMPYKTRLAVLYLCFSAVPPRSDRLTIAPSIFGSHLSRQDSTSSSRRRRGLDGRSCALRRARRRRARIIRSFCATSNPRHRDIADRDHRSMNERKARNVRGLQLFCDSARRPARSLSSRGFTGAQFAVAHEADRLINIKEIHALLAIDRPFRRQRVCRHGVTSLYQVAPTVEYGSDLHRSQSKTMPAPIFQAGAPSR